MAFDKTKPAEGANCPDIDGQIRDNWAALETVIGADNLSAETVLFDASAKVVNPLGTWDTSSYSADTIYGPAATSLFVSAYTSDDAINKTIQAITDSNASPTTVIDKQHDGDTGSNSTLSVQMVVKKGHYWKVALSGVGATASIVAITLGS